MRPRPDALELERERIAADRWSTDGCVCGACGQLVKVYRRNIYGTQAMQLLDLVRKYERKPGWYDLDGRDLCKLLYWGLVAMQAKDTETKGVVWKPTHKGVAWAHGTLNVPKYAYICNKELLMMDGEPTSVFDVLPEHFDYHSIWRT